MVYAVFTVGNHVNLVHKTVDTATQVRTTFFITYATGESCSHIDQTLFSLDNPTLFQDQLFAQQWHIHNTGQKQFSFTAAPGNDTNVLQVYRQYKLFGQGITIGIVDDGVEWRHPELQCGYKPELSADVDNDIKFQQPSVFDAHGTSCAGVCCGQGNNTECGIGVAFKSNNAGIRLLGNNFSDAKCAESLIYGLDQMDIYSNSWGPSDDGATIERYPLALAAIERGIQQGRNGKGVIYVWAAGNGYQRGDGANFDELANSPYSICVAASDWNGIVSSYSEPGANVLCNAPSSTRGYDRPTSSWKYYSTLTTADRMGFPGYNNALRSAGNCADDFGGTSAACPLAAGIIALILESNSNLTWRDVQWIIVLTSTRTDLQHVSWHQNAAGHYFSKFYGYGRLDAYKAVTMAMNWTNVCTNYVTETRSLGQDDRIVTTPIIIPKNFTTPLVVYTLQDVSEITVESVSIILSATARKRGQLIFAVASPSGTISILSEGRNNDYGSNYEQQIFSSVEFWGENARGMWAFSIYDNDRDKTQSGYNAYLTSVQLLVHGSPVNCTVEPATTVEPGTTEEPTEEPTTVEPSTTVEPTTTVEPSTEEPTTEEPTTTTTEPTTTTTAVPTTTFLPTSTHKPYSNGTVSKTITVTVSLTIVGDVTKIPAPTVANGLVLFKTSGASSVLTVLPAKTILPEKIETLYLTFTLTSMNVGYAELVIGVIDSSGKHVKDQVISISKSYKTFDVDVLVDASRSLRQVDVNGKEYTYTVSANSNDTPIEISKDVTMTYVYQPSTPTSPPMPLMNIVVLFAIVGSMLAAGILVIIVVLSRQKKEEQVTLPNVDLEMQSTEAPNAQLLQEDK